MTTKRGWQVDPRWDSDLFDDWQRKCKWVRAGYLRELAPDSKTLPRCQDLPPHAYHSGSLPANVQLYYIEYAWSIAGTHPDPTGDQLKEAVAVLEKDRANDDDLVWWDWSSVPQASRSAAEEIQFQDIMEGFYLVQTYVRVKCIVLRSFTCDRVWPLSGFASSSFCQRIVNVQDEHVKQNMTPEMLMSVDRRLRSPEVSSAHEGDRERSLESRRRFGSIMLKAVDDQLGFETACKMARYAWVKVWYIKELSEMCSPFPRCQDLPDGTFSYAPPPPGHAYVVSYPWASTLHPSPSGKKLKQLADVLAALCAEDDDGVFIDFCSQLQKGGHMPPVYYRMNESCKRDPDTGGLTDRTQEEEVRFRFQLCESTRLYAFKGNKVIVLPTTDYPDSFPESGDVYEELNQFSDPPRMDLRSAWGYSKKLRYEESGWCCVEFAVALKNKTIANLNDPAVQAVLRTRSWPTDVGEFADMMDEFAGNPIRFTQRGDRDAVRFNFFKFTYGFLETDLGSPHQMNSAAMAAMPEALPVKNPICCTIA